MFTLCIYLSSYLIYLFKNIRQYFAGQIDIRSTQR